MNLDQFKIEFGRLRDKGFVPSLRKGPTGVGYTAETILGIAENNLALPDIDGVELKSHREGASSLITLFTFNNKAWKMNPLEAVRKYGSRDREGRLGLYYTMSRTPNSAGLFLDVADDEISVRHVSGEVIAVWKLSNLVDRFKKKLPALLLITARTEERDGQEYFYYYRAQLMQETNAHLLKNLFLTGDILVDLRLHDSGTKARNHGTGFRVSESKIAKLFNNIIDL